MIEQLFDEQAIPPRPRPPDNMFDANGQMLTGASMDYVKGPNGEFLPPSYNPAQVLVTNRPSAAQTAKADNVPYKLYTFDPRVEERAKSEGLDATNLPNGPTIVSPNQEPLPASVPPEYQDTIKPLQPPGAKPSAQKVSEMEFLTEGWKKLKSEIGAKDPSEINPGQARKDKEAELWAKYIEEYNKFPEKFTPEYKKKWEADIKHEGDIAEKIAQAQHTEAVKVKDQFMAAGSFAYRKNQEDEDQKKRAAFEQLYPDMAGKIGTPGYAAAFLSYKNSAAETRTKAFGKVPTNVPGIFFDRPTGTYVTTEADGNQRVLSTDEVKALKLAYTGEAKSVQTANSTTFQRIVKNAEILTEGVKDPKTGEMRESELDKVVRLRNEVDDGTFGKMYNKFRTFNKWDQYLGYQFGDEKQAKLKSAIIANVERLGAVYAGGGTVTSDKKMELAAQLMDAALAKPAFSALIGMHKDSIRSTAAKFGAVEPVGMGATAPKANDPLGIR